MAQMGKMGKVEREEGADRRGAQRGAEVRRCGRGPPFGRVVLEKLEWEARQGRLSRARFLTSVRLCGCIFFAWEKGEIAKQSHLERIRRLRRWAQMLNVKEVMGFEGRIEWGSKKGKITKQSHFAPRGLRPLWRFAGFAGAHAPAALLPWEKGESVTSDRCRALEEGDSQ